MRIIFSEFLLIIHIIHSEPASAQQRSLFDWQWGMSCSEIEKEYGSDDSGFFGNYGVYEYDWMINSHLVKVKFNCSGAWAFNSGRLPSIDIDGPRGEIPAQQLSQYCIVLKDILAKFYGKPSKSKRKSFDGSYFYYYTTDDTAASLSCPVSNNLFEYYIHIDSCKYC